MTLSPLYQLLVAAAVGGVVGGLVVGLVGRSSADPSASSVEHVGTELASATDTPPPEEEPPDVGLEGRVAHLEKELATLRWQGRKRRQLESYARELAGDGGTGQAVDAEDPGFELAVRTVIDRALTERDEAREDRREDRRQRWVAGQLEHLTDELGLSDDQATSVEAILLQQMETFRDLRDPESENRPSTRQEWRQRIDEIRQQTRTALSEVLSDEQLTSYDKLQEEERGRGPRGMR